MKALDIGGQRFGRLLVIEKSSKRSKKGCVYWKCKCNCGKYKLVIASNLVSGHT